MHIKRQCLKSMGPVLLAYNFVIELLRSLFAEMFDDNVGISATQCFLRYLEYPDNEDCHLVTISQFNTNVS